jgi:peptidyl-prolyl cis-trans isomerase SurA
MNLMRFLTFMLIICAFFSFNLAGISNVRAQTANRIAAIVDQDLITLHELNNRIREMTGISADSMKERDFQKYQETRRIVLQRLIEEKIALNKIKELDIKVTESEIDSAIKTLQRDNQWSFKDLEIMLKDQGLTLDEYRDRIKKEIQRHKLVDFEVKSRIIISDQDIENYYEANKDKFQREPGVELATIFLFNRNPNDPQAKEKIIQEGTELLQRIRDGAGFGRIAEEHSEGPAAKEGGYLGRFDPQQLEPATREAIEKTPEGGVSDLIVNPNGVQIIKVLDKGGTGPIPLERVRDAIQRILFNQEMERRYNRWIRELKEKTYTKILIED